MICVKIIIIINKGDKNMNYYFQRLNHESEASYALFKNGIEGEKYLSLGWSCFLDTNILEAARLNDKSVAFEKIYDSVREKRVKSRWNMWYFARFAKGDKIVVPQYNGKFAICEVLEEAKSIKTISDNSFCSYFNNYDIHWDSKANLFACNGNFVDLGFIVKVKILFDDISKAEYADSYLTSRLKNRNANGCINDIKDSVENAIIALNQNQPINFYSDSMDNLAKELLNRIKKNLNPDKFELLVKNYMKSIGALASIPPKNEHGKEDNADADVLAYFDVIGVAVLIQTKFHSGQTDDWAVNQVSKYKEQMEDPECELDDGVEGFTYIPWVVSTCDKFTKEAIELAKKKDVKLINGIEFSKMILKQGLENLDLK